MELLPARTRRRREPGGSKGATWGPCPSGRVLLASAFLYCYSFPAVAQALQRLLPRSRFLPPRLLPSRPHPLWWLFCRPLPPGQPQRQLLPPPFPHRPPSPPHVRRQRRRQRQLRSLSPKSFSWRLRLRRTTSSSHRLRLRRWEGHPPTPPLL